MMTGKGPGPSGAARVGGMGPGSGKAGVKAVSPKQSMGKITVAGRAQSVPDKAAPGGAPKGMKTWTNNSKVIKG